MSRIGGLEDDLFRSNFMNTTTDYNELKHYLFKVEVILALASLPGIVANAIIIYSILQFKRMRTKTNIHILQWSISDLVFLLSTPSIYSLMLKAYGYTLSYKFHHVAREQQHILFILTTVLVLMLQADFTYERCSLKLYKIIGITLWVVAVVVTVCVILLSVHGVINSYAYFLSFFVFFVLLCVTIVKTCFYIKRCVRREDNKNTKFRFILTSAFVAMWFLDWFTFTCVHEIFSYYVETEVFVSILGHLNSVVKLILLANLDPNFKLCVMKVLRCSKENIDHSISYKSGTEDGYSLQDDKV